MLALRRRQSETREADLAWIYGAALRASADETVAAVAVKAALGSPDSVAGRRMLMARAVSSALEAAPAQPLDALPPQEREAVALARIVGMNVDEIAVYTDCEPGDVKARIMSGLRRLSGGIAAVGSV